MANLDDDDDVVVVVMVVAAFVAAALVVVMVWLVTTGDDQEVRTGEKLTVFLGYNNNASCTTGWKASRSGVVRG